VLPGTFASGLLGDLINPAALALIFSAVVLLVAVLIYNRLVRSRMQVREAWSGIDVQLKRRANLIPNLVETVKGYAAHEQTVFEEVTQARSTLSQASGPAESTQANSLLTGALGRLFAVAENYPELRASENFSSLQTELSDVEEKVAYARQFYNRNVLAYNTLTLTFPHALIASIFRFEPEEFFEADEVDRTPVAVDFKPEGNE
jgi:LemA protein